MRAEMDGRSGYVQLTLSRAEFRLHVEWLELIAPDDACTKDWRDELDRIDPLGDGPA